MATEGHGWGKAGIAALAAAVGAFAIPWRSAPAWAQALLGGRWALSGRQLDSGGSGRALEAGALGLLHAVGGTGAGSMSGGRFTVQFGLLGIQPAAAADLGRAHAFPVPFRPDLGHDRITFRGLTTNAAIRVYTITGELVRELSKSDGSTEDLVWLPVANLRGQPLASGVYLYVIEGDTGKKTGKLMILK